MSVRNSRRATAGAELISLDGSRNKVAARALRNFLLIADGPQLLFQMPYQTIQILFKTANKFPVTWGFTISTYELLNAIIVAGTSFQVNFTKT